MLDNKEGKKNVTLLGVTSFLNDFSSEMITPILPFFLSSLGASAVLIGLVGGLRDSLASLLLVLFGYLSDRSGKRKPFVYAGYLTSAFFKFLLAISPNAFAAVGAASLERTGKAMRDAPRDAMIGQLMPKRTGAGFGLHRMLDTAGAICGSIAVLAMIVFFALEYNMIMIIAALVSVLSVGPLILVKEPAFKPCQDTFGIRQALTKLPRKLLIFNLIASLFAFANFSYMFFILRAQAAEGIITSIVLYILFNVFYAAFAYPLGKRADKIGKKKVLTGGYLLFALVSFAFANFTGLAALIVLFAFYGIANAAVKGVERAYVTDLAPSDLKATSLGTFQMMGGIAALFSSVVAGLLWEYISPEATFMFGAIVSFSAALFLITQKSEPSPT